MARSPIIESSGNVFADLGLEHADKLHAKGELALAILRIIGERKLTQTQAAALLETDQSHISRLKSGRIEGFTFDRLLHFLNRLDHDVELRIRKKRPGSEVGTVPVAS